ncbi:hypothetical protein N657DRAFT_583122 [Parathielavia appendiculata]|uniref:Adhesin domain-containing protein n=1 Tax=Parathielavia appendiculata TaxID=2587402 RepID=A0AAN6YYU0_9PEZI|nr:hypothetical protein N657DRAFT_583122 [Parathielavia appendiculata]
MPYSDNLYSMLDDESDIEPNEGTSNQHGSYEHGVTSQHPAFDSNTVSTAATHAVYDAGDDVDAEDPQLFSPTDGYFGAAAGTSSGTVVPASSNVPHVPNVLVEDPSLERSAAEGKAREAEQERRRNDQGLPDSNDGDTPTVPSLAAGASRNGPTSAYQVPPSSQSATPSSASVAATYYAPSSSSRRPSAATPTSYTAYSQRSAYHGERFPFVPREAPPAYTPSPISPINSHGFDSASSNYRTFSQATHTVVNMGRPEETQGLLSHQPESMRDHNSDGLDEETPSWRGRIRKARRRLGGAKYKMMLSALLLLLVTAGFVTGLVSATRAKTGRHSPATDEPQTNPDQPKMSYPDVDGDFSWDTGMFCKDAQIPRHIQTYHVDFGADKQLKVVEKTSDDEGRRGWGEVHTQGTVVLRRAGTGTPNSAVTLEVTVTDERLPVYSSWDADSGSLKIIVPHRVEWSPDRPKACVNVKATVWVPENAALKLLNVDAVHLDIKLLDNLSLSVVEGTKLGSTVGAITAASTGTSVRDNQLIDIGAPASFTFNSRIIDVKTTAAPIIGTWPLYDYLGLQSTAGNIKVGIDPKPADPDTPKPAILYLKSLSGHVTFREPIHTAEATFRIAQALPRPNDRRQAELRAASVLPPRDYRVDVHTTSGDIIGAAAWSSSAGFKSTSGTISVDLLPVLDSSLAGSGDAREVALSTASTSGATDVSVLEPMWVDAAAILGGGNSGEEGGARGGYVALKTTLPSSTSSFAVSPSFREVGDERRTPLRCLHTAHTSTSANIKVVLPGSWEGDIGLSSLTGLLQVDGEGVKLIKAGSDWPGVNKQLLARKGEQGNGGKTTAKSTSGDVSVSVGKKE